MNKFQCLLLTLLLLSVSVMAQKRTITGKVLNQGTSDPLSGVNIIAEGEKGGATTRSDGSFSISVESKTTKLTFSYTGYASHTVSIVGKTEVKISLVTMVGDMNEVIVIGYGTQKKSHLTGAVSKFKNEKLDETPVSRLDQALQGKIAGVQIQNISSESGSDPKIRVRGLSSVSAGADPLVVVDGHPVPDGLAYVNMADVESVEVLKDAASAAIYGSRGGAGVIMITTKAGKSGKPKYGLKFSAGQKSVYERYPMMTTSEYTKLLFDEAALKAKDPSIIPPTGTAIIANNERAAYIVENTILGGMATDWQDAALRNGNVQNLQLNVSGGSPGLKYFLSGAYQKDQGMMFHSEYDRFSMRGKLDADLGKKVKVSFNFNPSYIKRERPSVNYIDFVRFQSFLPVYHTEASAAFVNQDPLWAAIRPGDFAQARHFNARTYTGLMPDGSTYNSGTTKLDPFNTANNTPKSVMETRTISTNDYRMQSSGDITINILPGLDFKTMGSVYVNYTNGLDFAKRNSNRDGDVNRGVYTNRLLIDLLMENILSYNKQIKDHSINLIAGFTAQRTTTDEDRKVGLDYPSDNVTTLNTAVQVEQPSTNANGIPQGTYSLKDRVGLLSYLTRAAYSFKNKYLFSASMRADGSSYFAPGNRWGYFPSVSVGWVITQEDFMESVKWMNTLKLRASYGVTGNNRIPAGSAYDLLYSANYALGTGTGTVVSGQSPSKNFIGNPDISWERTFQYNGGIDLALFNNAVNMSVDVYQSKTEALLLQQSSMALTGVDKFWNNIGSLQNRGIEVELTTNNFKRRNFKWTTSANISHNKNKVIELGLESQLLNQGERTELYLNKPGGPLVQYLGYKTDGVWLSQADITAAQAGGLSSALSNIFVPGGLKLVDINNDKKIDANDRTVIGSPYPAFTWGLTNNVTYKAFDLSVMVQGVQGGTLVNGDPNYNETKRYNKNYNANRWLSPMSPGDGKTPYSTIGFNWMLTDYVVEDASYVALREIIVGYTLPSKVAKAIHLSSMRFYFSAQNLYFRSGSNYRGINPEARFTSGPYATPGVDGYQRGGFPMPKTVLFGLDINF